MNTTYHMMVGLFLAGGGPQPGSMLHIPQGLWPGECGNLITPVFPWREKPGTCSMLASVPALYQCLPHTFCWSSAHAHIRMRPVNPYISNIIMLHFHIWITFCDRPKPSQLNDLRLLKNDLISSLTLHQPCLLCNPVCGTGN